MVFSGVTSVFCLLLLKCLLVSAQTWYKPISLQGRYTCSLHPANELWLELRAWDQNAYATRMNAINAQEDEMTSCPVSGLGTVTSPFYMTTKIRMTDSAEVFNLCGMTKTTVNGRTVYNWRVKAYTYPFGADPNNIDFILSLHCDTSDLADGLVETRVNIDVSRFTVTAASPADVTGVGSIATNANIIYSANLYPNGHSVPDALQNAKGFYFYNCYSANNIEMTDKERFLDAYGCPVSGATYAPTSSFKLVNNTGDYLKIEAKYARAVLIGGKKTIYITCSVDKCTSGSDPYCQDSCEAYKIYGPPTIRIDPAVTFATSFTVQDQIAHQLTPAPSGDTSAVLTTANVGDTIKIVAFNSPGGIGGSTDLLDAKGFYVYNCKYARNQQMAGATQFINDNGCLIQNTILSPQSDFMTDYSLTSQQSNSYYAVSGDIVLRNNGNARLYVQCDTGKCTADGHNYCIKRCGATDNIAGGAVNLGYRGHSFTLSILDRGNVPALQLNLQGPNGRAISGTSDTVDVGDQINFGVDATPGGTGTAGAAFENAKGIFIQSCTATVNGRESKFIENGCPVPGSPYRTSGDCLDATVDGVPPFNVDCGKITVPEEGDVVTSCEIWTCLTENNIFCENRCAAGDIQSNSNVSNPGATTTSSFKAVPRDDRRTSVRSDELRNIITAVSVVGALLLLLGVFLGTYCVVMKQKGRAKRRRDRRLYNY